MYYIPIFAPMYNVGPWRVSVHIYILAELWETHNVPHANTHTHTHKTYTFLSCPFSPSLSFSLSLTQMTRHTLSHTRTHMHMNTHTHMHTDANWEEEAVISKMSLRQIGVMSAVVVLKTAYFLVEAWASSPCFAVHVLRTFMYRYIYVDYTDNKHAHTHVYINVFMHTYMFAYLLAYIHTYIHVYI